MSEEQKFTRPDCFKDDYAVLSKDILQKGTGEDHPFKGCKVLFRCTPRSNTNDLDSSIQNAPEVMKLVSKSNSLEKCLTSMKKGEKSLFTITKVVGALAFLKHYYVELELINWRLPDFDQNGSTELVLARKLKLSGIGLYQQKKYEEALRVYINCISCLAKSSSGESQHIKVGVYLNMAMCHQKLNDPENAKKDCKNALKIVPNHIKALYLHGSLNLKSGDIHTALEDFQKVQKLDRTDKLAIRQIEICHKHIQEKENIPPKETVTIGNGAKESSASGELKCDKHARKGVKLTGAFAGDKLNLNII